MGVLAVVFSFLLSLAFVVGAPVYETGSLDPLFASPVLAVLKLLGLGLLFSVFSLIAFQSLSGYDKKPKKPQWKIFRSKYLFFFLWVAIFLAFVPSFLAHFPGIFTYDAAFQTYQAELGFHAISRHHPPLHTFIWFLCLRLTGDHTAALVAYSLVQMLVLSAVFARLITFLARKQVDNWLVLIAFLFLALNPVVAVFSVVMTKDVYFAAFFLLFVIELVRLVSAPKDYLKKWHNWLFFVLAALFACLFRNNAIYVLILTAAVVIFCLKGLRARAFLLFLAPVLSFFLISGPVYNAFGFGKNELRETLSIPFQQLAYVYNHHAAEIPAEKLETLSKFAPLSSMQKYESNFADPIKEDVADGILGENKLEFLKLWASLLVRYPADYVSAFLATDAAFWYPASSALDHNGHYIENGDYYKDMYGGIAQDSKLPALQSFYRDVSDFRTFEHLPVINFIFGLAFPLWFTLFCFVALFFHRAAALRRLALAFLPAFFLWLSYILGPTANFRYIFPIFVLYPLFLALIFRPSSFASSRSR